MRWRHFKLLFILVFFSHSVAAAGELSDFQRRIRAAGDDMLENLEVSYVYGGSKIGDAGTCERCNSCLEERRPAPKERFKECGVCAGCSLDCSHFTQLVFARAGLGFPYLTSAQMLDLSAPALEKKYNLRPVSAGPVVDPGLVIPGDMLVYRGHVVIVETVHNRDSADIIHATGGKDIREPGQGIQRERFVKMSAFRGELLRILRHSRLDDLRSVESGGRVEARAPGQRYKLRRVEKKRVD